MYEGRLGGGKSYHAVLRICARLGRGGYVYHNLDLVVPEIEAYVLRHHHWRVQPGQLTRLDWAEVAHFAGFTRGGSDRVASLVVIDEAHFAFNARDWSKADRSLLGFLTISRHTNTDVIFMSQHANNVDKQVLRLVQYIWAFRDMQKWRVPVFRCYWPFPHLLTVQYDYDGRTELWRHWELKNPAVYRLYVSKQHALRYERAAAAGDLGAAGRVGGFEWGRLVAMACVLVACCGCAWIRRGVSASKRVDQVERRVDEMERRLAAIGASQEKGSGAGPVVAGQPYKGEEERSVVATGEIVVDGRRRLLTEAGTIVEGGTLFGGRVEGIMSDVVWIRAGARREKVNIEWR